MLRNAFPQTKTLVVDNRYVLREAGKIATRKEEPLTSKIVCVATKQTSVMDNLLIDGRKGVVDNKRPRFPSTAKVVFHLKKKNYFVADDKLCYRGLDFSLFVSIT